MRKILAILLSVCLLAASTPLTALASVEIEKPYEKPYEEPYDGTTIYDLKNEIESPLDIEPDYNLGVDMDHDIGAGLDRVFTPEDDSDIYTDYSFDFENARQLKGDFVLDEIILKFHDAKDVPGKEKQLQKEIEKVEKVGLIEDHGIYVVKADDLRSNANAVLNRYKNNKFVEYALSDYFSEEFFHTKKVIYLSS